MTMIVQRMLTTATPYPPAARTGLPRNPRDVTGSQQCR
jgi:hypothetical protein